MGKASWIRWGGMASLLLFVVVGPLQARDDCLCRDVEVVCEVRPSTRILVGEPSEFCATVINEGTYPLENLRLQMRLCSGMVVKGGGCPLITIPKLDVGQTHQHCVELMPTMVGPCRLIAFVVDGTAITSAACACDVVVEGLPALQLQMVDLDVRGEPQGIFRVGEEVAYLLLVEEDEGSASASDLVVEWYLPPELEFVRGQGPLGTTVTGSGQSVGSSVFGLVAGDQKEFRIVVKVVEAPAHRLVQTAAEVRTAGGGQILAQETESTTLRN